MVKHHYVVSGVMHPYTNDCLVPVGAICEEQELGENLKHLNVKRYKVKSIDGKPVPDWEKSDWVAV